MSWVFKGDNCKYLHKWEPDLFGTVTPTWVDTQDLAFRFADRNVASRVVFGMRLAGRIKRLTPKGITKTAHDLARRLQKLEAEQVSMRASVMIAKCAMPLPGDGEVKP